MFSQQSNQLTNKKSAECGMVCLFCLVDTSLVAKIVERKNFQDFRVISWLQLQTYRKNTTECSDAKHSEA